MTAQFPGSNGSGLHSTSLRYHHRTLKPMHKEDTRLSRVSVDDSFVLKFQEEASLCSETIRNAATEPVSADKELGIFAV